MDPDPVGSGFNSPAWIRIRIRIQDRIRIRIQRTLKSGRNVDRMISFHKINRDLQDFRPYSTSFKLKTYDWYHLPRNFYGPGSGSGSGFRVNLDPDPDSSDYLDPDPDSMYPDPHPCNFLPIVSH